MPEWLAVTLWVVAALAAVLAYSAWKHRRQLRKLVAKRPDPTHDEFVAMLAGSVDLEIAEWMWDTLTIYYRPHTPHPDDDLINDALIDSDDITMDWLPAFAKSRGLRWKDWADWPDGWEVTARNYARWLQMGIA